MTLFGWINRRNQVFTPVTAPEMRTAQAVPLRTLAGVQPGGEALIKEFSARLSPERRTQLQAYGVLPGRWVSVLQHSPVTVLQVEHLELALETEIAGEIYIDYPKNP